MCECDKSCGCCKRAVISVDWSKIPSHFNFLTIDSSSGEIWLWSDLPSFSVTRQGGIWKQMLPLAKRAVSTMIGFITRYNDGTPKVSCIGSVWHGIPKVAIEINWNKLEADCGNAITTREDS